MVVYKAVLKSRRGLCKWPEMGCKTLEPQKISKPQKKYRGDAVGQAEGF